MKKFLCGSMHLTSLFLITVFVNIQLGAQDLASLINSEKGEVISLEEGLAISVLQVGKGTKAAVGDYVKVNYEGRLLNGNVFDKNSDGEPLVFQLGRRQVIAGWEQCLVQLRAGAKATLYIPSSFGYGPRGIGETIPPNSDLVFDVQLLEIMDQDAYDLYMDEQEEKAKTAYKLKQRRQFQQELQVIREYVKQEKLSTKDLKSGLSLRVKKKGKKQLAKSGSTVKVAYTGYLLDGTVFDKTEPGQPFEFTLGEGKVIPGWEEGLTYFAKGGQGKLIIPSQLAYGPRPITEGDITIPGNSILVFDIKVVELTHPVKE